MRSLYHVKAKLQPAYMLSHQHCLMGSCVWQEGVIVQQHEINKFGRQIARWVRVKVHHVIRIVKHLATLACLHDADDSSQVSLMCCPADATWRPQQAQVCSCWLIFVLQVLLVWPHQMSLTGITPGLILMISSGVISSWTMWLLIVLYIQRKQILVSCKYRGCK